MKNLLYICLVTTGLSFFSCDSSLEKYPLDKPSSSTYPSNDTEL